MISSGDHTAGELQQPLISASNEIPRSAVAYQQQLIPNQYNEPPRQDNRRAPAQQTYLQHYQHNNNSNINNRNQQHPEFIATPAKHNKKIKKTTSGHEYAEDEELIYTSSEKGSCYMNCLRWLWCGCCEPFQRITTEYVEDTGWKGCQQYTESIAFENIMDIRREQTICCMCFSLAPCCCCINDFADIVLYGNDASMMESKRKDEKHGKIILGNVANSFRVYETITAHLQRRHKLWRKQGRIYKRKIELVESCFFFCVCVIFCFFLA